MAIIKDMIDPQFVFMKIITDLFSPESLLIVSLVLIIYFLSKKRFSETLIMISALGGGYIVTYIIKHVVMKPRPEISLITETGYSFPSGHAVIATIFFILIIYLFIFKLKSTFLKYFLTIISIILILSTSYSRVYLGVHWVSDVVAGVVLGTLWTIFVIKVLKNRNTV